MRVDVLRLEAVLSVDPADEVEQIVVADHGALRDTCRARSKHDVSGIRTGSLLVWSGRPSRKSLTKCRRLQRFRTVYRECGACRTLLLDWATVREDHARH